jgi:hypothetical protein
MSSFRAGTLVEDRNSTLRNDFRSLLAIPIKSIVQNWEFGQGNKRDSFLRASEQILTPVTGLRT